MGIVLVLEAVWQSVTVSALCDKLVFDIGIDGMEKSIW